MSEFLTSINKVIQRDLAQLEKEIAAYPDELAIWKVSDGIKNPAGNLCLHLCGNLQHFIGAVLGRTGYVRDRDSEFARKNVPRKELLEEINKAKRAVEFGLTSLDPSLLSQNYPVMVFETPMTTEYFLIHLAAHLGYHLGQVNYHRRILIGNA